MSRVALLGFACALFCLIVPSTATAVPTVEDKESARNLFHMGDEKFRAGDYEGALVSFKAADAIMHLPTTGLEVGRTLAKLDKLIEAREKFRQVAMLEPEEDEMDVQADARAEAKELFQKLADRIPSLQVRLKAPDEGHVGDVTVRVDGESLTKEAALLPRRVNPGTHRVIVTVPGYQREERKVTVREGQAFVLEVDLVPRSPRRPAPAPSPDPVQPPSAESEGAASAPTTAIGVVLLAIGGASLVVGGTTGVLTLVEASELEDSCPDKRCTPGEEDQLDKTVTMSHVSTATLVAGGALAGAGLLTLLLGGASDDVSEPEGAVVVRPILAPTYIGVRGAF